MVQTWHPVITARPPVNVAAFVRLAIPRIVDFDWYWMPEGNGTRLMFRDRHDAVTAAVWYG